MILKPMTTRILIIITLLFSALTLSAQADKHNHKGSRAEWFSEMSDYKAKFIASELKLTDSQKQKFVDIYRKMENESAQVARETRQMEKSVREKGDKATDLELEKAAEAGVELKMKQAQIEQKYFAQFKSILTPAQLFNLSKAERKFTRKIMDSHRKSRHNRD